MSGKTRVTLENAAGAPQHFEANDVVISSDNGGRTYDLAFGYVTKPSPSCPQIDGYSVDDKALCDPPVSKAEQTMIDAAQIVERTVLMAARNLQDAQRTQQKMIDDANAHFNAAILNYLHTGKGNIDATKALEKAGVWATDDRTAAVACFELDKLYGVDTLETGV